MSYYILSHFNILINKYADFSDIRKTCTVNYFCVGRFYCNIRQCNIDRQGSTIQDLLLPTVFICASDHIMGSK